MCVPPVFERAQERHRLVEQANESKGVRAHAQRV